MSDKLRTVISRYNEIINLQAVADYPLHTVGMCLGALELRGPHSPLQQNK
jgi:hypothetical protein